MFHFRREAYDCSQRPFSALLGKADLHKGHCNLLCCSGFRRYFHFIMLFLCPLETSAQTCQARSCTLLHHLASEVASSKWQYYGKGMKTPGFNCWDSSCNPSWAEDPAAVLERLRGCSEQGKQQGGLKPKCSSLLFPQCQTPSEGIGMQKFCKLSCSRSALLQAEFSLPAAAVAWVYVVINGSTDLKQIIRMPSAITRSFSLKPAWHPAPSNSHVSHMHWFFQRALNPSENSLSSV